MLRKNLVRIIVLLGVLWAVLIGLLYIQSGKYLDHIIIAIKKQFDHKLQTEIHLQKDDIHFSFLRSFPKATLTIDNILIKSATTCNAAMFNSYVGYDTLLYAQSLHLYFDLRSVLTARYKLIKLEIQNGILHILRDKQGNVNYQIMKKNISDLPASPTFHVDLNRVELNKTQVTYHDLMSGVLLQSQIEASQITGVFANKEFDVHADISTKSFYLRMDDYYLRNESEDLWNISLARETDRYIIKNGAMRFMGIPLQCIGLYNALDKSYRVQLVASNASIKRMYKFIPQNVYNKLRFKPVSGQLGMKTTITGYGAGRPKIDGTFHLDKGLFNIPNSRINIQDVYITGSVSNGKARMAETTQLVIDTVFCKWGQSTLNGKGAVENFKQPVISGELLTNFELEKLLIVPQIKEKYKVAGTINLGLKFSGAINSFANMNTSVLKQFQVSGYAQIENGLLEWLNKAYKNIHASGQLVIHSLQHFSFKEMTWQMGKSLFVLQGNLYNTPFFQTHSNEFPRLSCSIRSEEFFVSDFTKQIPDNVKKPNIVVLADSIIINANVSFGKFHYGRFDGDNILGVISLNNGVLNLRDVTINTYKGNIRGNVMVKTGNGEIDASGNASIRSVDISKLFYSFHNFGQDIITHNYLGGSLSGNLNMQASWDYELRPLPDKLWVNSHVRIDQGELINYPTLLSLSDFISVEELQHVKFDRLETDVEVKDRKVIIAQTRINSSAISLAASGMHDFDNRYDYRFQVQLADVLWKRAKKRKPKNSEFGYIVDDGLGRTTIPLKIVGKDTVFKVSYDRQMARGSLRRKLHEERNEWKELVSGEEESGLTQHKIDNTDQYDNATGEPGNPKKAAEDKLTDKDEATFEVIWDDE